MNYRFSELKKKWVVNSKKGSMIGKVGDLEIDADTNCVTALIVVGRLKLFGLLGKDDDVIIQWDDIDIIGDDAVLVSIEPLTKRRERDRRTDRGYEPQNGYERYER